MYLFISVTAIDKYPWFMDVVVVHIPKLLPGVHFVVELL